jgi:hypothetical protein
MQLPHVVSSGCSSGCSVHNSSKLCLSLHPALLYISIACQTGTKELHHVQAQRCTVGVLSPPHDMDAQMMAATHRNDSCTAVNIHLCMMQQHTFQVLTAAAAVAATAAGTLCDPVVIHAPGPKSNSSITKAFAEQPSGRTSNAKQAKSKQRLNISCNADEQNIAK